MIPSLRNSPPLAGCLSKFRSDRRGNIAIASALLAPVLLGTFGLGTEVASWYSMKRQMQNAVDSAATAAATNASDDFADEAKAVTARYGLANGTAGVVVTALDAQACPDGSNECYRVTVKKPVPLSLATLVGYKGDTTVNGAPAIMLSATALAVLGTSPRPYCIVALAHSGASQAIRTNGAPKADLTGCNVMSNTDAVCNGHDLMADVGDAHGTNDGCGIKRNSGLKPLTDQYAAKASQIPTVPCSSFPSIPQKKRDASLPPENQLSGQVSISSTPKAVCGDLQLTGDTTINTDATGGVLVIRNGDLDLNGYKLMTADGSAVTILFTGENGPNYSHTLTGDGVLDIEAPKTGPWSGMAVYENPTLTQNVDINYAGNSPTWNITGMVYAPNAKTTFSGAVNKSSHGASCFTLMVDSLLVNGTGSILSKGECKKAGVQMPTGPVPSRGKLVS